jgi:hypothetical protein
MPALRIANTDLVVVGTQPYETYRRWIEPVGSRVSGGRDNQPNRFT